MHGCTAARLHGCAIAPLQARADAYAALVLASLPWVGRDLNARDTEHLGQIMDTIKVYVEQRETKHVSVLQVFADAEHTLKQEDSLELLWKQINGLCTLPCNLARHLTTPVHRSTDHRTVCHALHYFAV